MVVPGADKQHVVQNRFKFKGISFEWCDISIQVDFACSSVSYYLKTQDNENPCSLDAKVFSTKHHECGTMPQQLNDLSTS